MKSISVTVSIPVDAFLSQISSAEVAGDAPDPGVPELQALAFYAGRWESQVFGKPHLKETEVAEWVLNGSFLRQCWSTEGSEKGASACGMTLMTFDASRETYLSWSFLAKRSVVCKEGVWDASSRTMTWTNQLAAPGECVVTKSTFVEDGINAWSIREIDATGKVVRAVDGKSTRTGV